MPPENNATGTNPAPGTQGAGAQEPAGATAQGGAPQAQPGAASPAAAQRTTVDQLPANALAARLRASKDSARKELLSELGIADPEAFKAAQTAAAEKLAGYERAAEEAKRAAMSETDRLKADLAAKDARIAELEGLLAQRESAVQAAKADVMVRDTVSAHIDPDMADVASELLKKHVRSLSATARARFGKEDADAFFAQLAKDKPKFAKTTPAAPPARAPIKRPLGNGAAPAKVIPASPTRLAAGSSNGAKPKTAEEIRAGWAKFGAKPPMAR